MSALGESPSADATEAPKKGEQGSGRFDAVEYYHSSRGRPRSLRSLPGLSRTALRLARQANPRLFYLLVGAQLAGAVLLGVQVILGKLAIEAIVREAGGDGNFGAVAPSLLGLVAATAIGTLALSSQTQLQRLLGEHVQRLTWTSILRVTTGVPLATFESPAFFDELQRVKTNALIRPLTLAQGLVQLVGGLLGVVGISVALLVMQPLVLPILLAAGVPLFLLSRRSGRLEFNFTVSQTPQMRVRAYLLEALSGREEAKEIRAFDLGGVLSRRWERSHAHYLADFGSHVRRRLKIELLMAAATIVSTSLALGLLIWFVLDGRLAIGTAGAGIIAIRLLSGRLQQLFTGTSSLFESSLFLEDLQHFLARTEVTRDDDGGGVRPEPFDELRAEDVHFRYPGAARDALDGVSMSVRAGEVIALVGENGSGKTTLAKLLAHLFEPTSGRILWDGVDVRDLDERQLRSRVGVIFQDFVRYQLSARENIAFGRAEAAEDLGRVTDAARRGGAHDFLSTLPDGYETSLGKQFLGGYDLSLGQWQRVAISRAFFRDGDFLILDEPTASLDARLEHQLFESVRELARGRTVLLISHRFSTVKSADRIYVLHDGRITEQGSHDELMRQEGRYAELFELQARSYR